MRTDALLVALMLLPWPAFAADEPRVSADLRMSGMAPGGGGYRAHAETFGWEGLNGGLGARLELGLRVAPRLWLVGAFSAHGASAVRRDQELQLTDRSLTAGLRVALWRHDLTVADGSVTFGADLELSAVAGYFHLAEDLDGLARDAAGPGARTGIDAIGRIGPFGFVIGYALTVTRASLADRLGGTIGPGGHEITAGFRASF